MPLFDSTTVTRMVNQGEQSLSVEKPFLSDRYSFPTVIGTSVYTLPNYVTSIRRVTYKGTKLDPLPQRNQREVFQGATQVSKPFWYIFDNMGQNKISLFPAPAENLAAGSGATLYSSDIPNCVIVEFWRVTDNSIFVIPAYLRRQLLKQYSSRQLLTLEGPGQKKSLVKYYEQKWDVCKQSFIDHIDFMQGRPRKLIINSINAANYFPGSPMLPISRFGVGVDEGY